MKFQDLTQEQVNQAKGCKTREDILSFIQDHNIELTEEQMREISGGGNREVNHSGTKVTCPHSPTKKHAWVFTGRTRPGSFFGDIWPDYLQRCKYCGTEEWQWIK